MNEAALLDDIRCGVGDRWGVGWGDEREGEDRSEK